MRTNDYNTVGDAFGEFPAYTRGLREIATRFGYCFFPLRPRFRLFGLTGYSCAINAKNIFYFNGFRILLASLSLFFFYLFYFLRHSPRLRVVFPKLTERRTAVEEMFSSRVIPVRKSCTTKRWYMITNRKVKNIQGTYILTHTVTNRPSFL